MCSTGVADAVTGTQAWFGPVYLLVIGYSAWSLGWGEATVVGLGCMAITLGVNGFHMFPYGSLPAIWNVAMRILAIVMIIGLLDNARRSYTREWWHARTDPLTGALNRQAFYEAAGAASQSRSWNLIAYADLDGLKRLNDRRGHEAGDACLKDYAAQVKKMIRKEDVFARVGGDEFVVYMMIRDEEAAHKVASRLHLAMNSVISLATTELRCSLGVLVLPPGARSIDREVRLADELMYEAKACGGSLTVATAHDREGEIFVVRHSRLEPSLPPEAPVRTEPAPRRPALIGKAAA
jgi:diguanylate cyclase (GGDEF)-like protein